MHKTRSGVCYGRIHKGGVTLIVIRPQGIAPKAAA